MEQQKTDCALEKRKCTYLNGLYEIFKTVCVMQPF